MSGGVAACSGAKGAKGCSGAKGWKGCGSGPSCPSPTGYLVSFSPGTAVPCQNLSDDPTTNVSGSYDGGMSAGPFVIGVHDGTVELNGITAHDFTVVPGNVSKYSLAGCAGPADFGYPMSGGFFWISQGRQGLDVAPLDGDHEDLFWGPPASTVTSTTTLSNTNFTEDSDPTFFNGGTCTIVPICTNVSLVSATGTGFTVGGVNPFTSPGTNEIVADMTGSGGSITIGFKADGDWYWNKGHFIGGGPNSGFQYFGSDNTAAWTSAYVVSTDVQMSFDVSTPTTGSGAGSTVLYITINFIAGAASFYVQCLNCVVYFR